MKSCVWLPAGLAFNSRFPWPLSVKPVHVFPLSALAWLHGALVSRLQAACSHQRYRWHGLRPIAADKTTLTLPESQSLYKRFGAHKGQQGLGPIALELRCLFDLISRAPLRFVYDKVCTSEHKLILKLIKALKKGDLLLIDSGFYYCATFIKILSRQAHFLIPAKSNNRPKVLRTLGQSDYLCQIKDSHDHKALIVRVLYVYRKGFRRRLVTSLLDPILFPASQLANLYHMRWDIETFYRDFKHTMCTTCWHCRKPASFHQELLVHMIVLCLFRIAMLEASQLVKVCVGQLSFARALTETRLFFKLLLSAGQNYRWTFIWAAFVKCCARYRVKAKPNRHFTRDQQEYRRKSRSLERKRPGRKPKATKAFPSLLSRPEILKNRRDGAYLLS